MELLLDAAVIINPADASPIPCPLIVISVAGKNGKPFLTLLAWGRKVFLMEKPVPSGGVALSKPPPGTPFYLVPALSKVKRLFRIPSLCLSIFHSSLWEMFFFSTFFQFGPIFLFLYGTSQSLRYEVGIFSWFQG